jgi:hypothetical protein
MYCHSECHYAGCRYAECRGTDNLAHQDLPKLCLTSNAQFLTGKTWTSTKEAPSVDHFCLYKRYQLTPHKKEDGF